MDAAGPVSKFFFLWAEPLVWAGFRRPLVKTDALRLPRRLAPAEIYGRFVKLWSQEAATIAKPACKTPPSVLRVLRQLLGSYFLLALGVQTLAILLKLGAVLVLRRLVQLISEGGNWPFRTYCNSAPTIECQINTYYIIK